jgi:Glu-tRNA(Gln) amidotransferase subunit E-like FAD-binding protein
MLENEEVAAKDLAIIVKFLKDNDITVDVLESAPVQDIISSMKKNAVAYDDLDDLLESC